MGIVIRERERVFCSTRVISLPSIMTEQVSLRKRKERLSTTADMFLAVSENFLKVTDLFSTTQNEKLQDWIFFDGKSCFFKDEKGFAVCGAVHRSVFIRI